ncbi:putative damage-inducible protein DinB [Flavobacterium gossypii]|uniref:Damage-inducible protein DinB n=1 Tax=Flavobacterium gossypii TaxID=1646119 RepID=A0ABR6DTV9_9FLAO|nr:DinB family protein [Flavobacterium gossypii]MBA9075131.1 putative damage-inducible protein DinB [Flavobacterium gossypii]
MKTSQLLQAEYAPYYATYISKVEEADLVEELEISVHEFIKFVQNIPLDKYDYSYAEGKWTIKDIIQHLMDSERIFAYRALRIARNDKTPLASFEENEYAAIAGANQRSIRDLLTELSIVRQSTIALFKTFSEDVLKRIGVASGYDVSVRALGVIIIGHQKHHQRIFMERYL